MEPLVSIIVPVYNAEKTLERCVDSVLHQEYKNLELILINDGSTDSSGALCRAFADDDPRVRLIDKANSGVSDSRNRGIDAAQGEYIQFLDSDDWITPDATRLMVGCAQRSGCDLVVADFYRVVGDKVAHKGSIQENAILTLQEYAEYMMESPADFYYGVLWNKLYREDILRRTGLRMNVDIHWCEDFLFNLEYLRHVKTVQAIQAPVYYYVKTKGSLVAQSATLTGTVQTKLKVFQDYQKFYKDIYTDEEYEEQAPRIYRFLISAAKDGVVAPSIAPGTKKLGTERPTVHLPAIQREGLLTEQYRYRKLLERYYTSIAEVQQVTLTEVQLMACLNSDAEIVTVGELVDFSGLPKNQVKRGLEQLEKREMLRILPKSKKRPAPEIELMKEAQPLLRDIAHVEEQVRGLRCAGFTQEELETLDGFEARITQNLRSLFE
ncbi:MAG: glycosyltransferase [Clostridiales bacterium]|nr:glycosyltransferase [Clostridiales bacterium]